MSRSEIREVELPEGGRFFVEVDVPGTSDVRGKSASVIPWGSIEEQIAAVSQNVTHTLRDALPGRPTRWGVEFGIKLTAETGTMLGVLAKVSGESTIVIRAEWESEGSQDGE